MRGLWRKELRSLAPFIALVLLLGALDLSYEFATEYPHQQALATELNEIDHAEWLWGGVFMLIVTLALSSGLLVREFDTGAIEFLDALPVRRIRIFAVKAGLAVLVLVLLPVGDTVTVLMEHALSRTSLDRSFHMPLLLKGLFLSISQILVLLGWGLLVSFLRRFAWVVTALVCWAYIGLGDRLPAIRTANVFMLNVPVFHGDRWVIPWKMLAVQLPLGLAAMALAGAAFCGAGERLLGFYRRHRHSVAGRIAPAVGTVMIAIAAISLAAWIAYQSDDSESDVAQPHFQEWSVSGATTTRYAAIYPSNLESRAREALARADATYETVRRFLRAAPTKPMALDFTGAAENHAGVAFWKTARIDLANADSVDDVTATLAHETTHIFIDLLSERRLSEAYHSTRFFHEGLATYVQYRFFDAPEALELLRSVAATTRARGKLDFGLMADDAKLARLYDLDLAYPLGELFVAALIATHDDGAPAKILAAFARPDAPRGLKGEELWRDIFQAAGYDLERVITRFYAELDAQIKNQRTLIDGLPRLFGVLQTSGKQIGIRVDGVYEGWSVVCRFRPDGDSKEREYIWSSPGQDGVFWIDRWRLPARSFWYQLGWHEVQTGRGIFEKWVEAPMPR